MIQSRLVVAVLLLAVGGAVGWFINGWRLGELHAKYQLAQAQLVADTQEAAAAKGAAWRDQVAKLDQHHAQELEDADQEISDLRRRLADGTHGMRVAASCGDVPTETGAASVDDERAPELTAAAEQDYLDFRARYTRQWHQLTACQEFIRTACQ